MKVLLATNEQKKDLEGIYKSGSELKFILDFNNNWVVNKNVIDDGNFSDINKQLKELKEIEFIPAYIP